MPRHACLLRCSLLLALLGLAACQTPGDGRPTHMRNTELAGLIKSGAPPVIVDVRSAREYRQGHIPGALHIPFWQTFFRADSITAARDDTVVVTCAHGPRAGVGKFALQLAGFRNVVYLDGHMSGWYKASLPVVAGTD
jgi:rhodanese-related sulfurtransferase